MILCFDLDNVICVTKNMQYKNAKPIVKTIKHNLNDCSSDSDSDSDSDSE